MPPLLLLGAGCRNRTCFVSLKRRGHSHICQSRKTSRTWVGDAGIEPAWSRLPGERTVSAVARELSRGQSGLPRSPHIKSRSASAISASHPSNFCFKLGEPMPAPGCTSNWRGRRSEALRSPDKWQGCRELNSDLTVRSRAPSSVGPHPQKLEAAERFELSSSE